MEESVVHQATPFISQVLPPLKGSRRFSALRRKVIAEGGSWLSWVDAGLYSAGLFMVEMQEGGCEGPGPGPAGRETTFRKQCLPVKCGHTW